MATCLGLSELSLALLAAWVVLSLALWLARPYFRR
jgi:hypothetical protein